MEANLDYLSKGENMVKLTRNEPNCTKTILNHKDEKEDI